MGSQPSVYFINATHAHILKIQIPRQYVNMYLTNVILLPEISQTNPLSRVSRIKIRTGASFPKSAARMNPIEALRYE
jgi:hypothetical protein